MEKIICAAIHIDDGIKHVNQAKNIDTGFIVCGRRHNNCIDTVDILTERSREYLGKMGRDAQGFMTSENRYLGRKEAFLIAQAAGQLIYKPSAYPTDGSAILISEDLYSEDIY